MTTQGFVAITLAIASANIHGVAYAAPWCHPGDKVTITAIIGDVKANLISLKPGSSRPCRINTVVGGVRGNKNAQRPRNCTAGRTSSYARWHNEPEPEPDIYLMQISQTASNFLIGWKAEQLPGG